MNSAIQSIVLLACIAICPSASIKNCHCVKTIQAVKRTLIADVRVYEPRPYCSKYEVIVIQKDKSKRCLDPESEFTKNLLKAKTMQMANADKTKGVAPKTSTAATTTSAATTL